MQSTQSTSTYNLVQSTQSIDLLSRLSARKNSSQQLRSLLFRRKNSTPLCHHLSLIGSLIFSPLFLRRHFVWSALLLSGEIKRVPRNTQSLFSVPFFPLFVFNAVFHKDLLAPKCPFLCITTAAVCLVRNFSVPSESPSIVGGKFQILQCHGRIIKWT